MQPLVPRVLLLPHAGLPLLLPRLLLLSSPAGAALLLPTAVLPLPQSLLSGKFFLSTFENNRMYVKNYPEFFLIIFASSKLILVENSFPALGGLLL